MTDYLVIPCIEMLRLYYGVSSRLLSSVVRGETNFYVDWESSEVSDGVPNLKLNYRLSKLEMIVLARAMMSRFAWKKLQGVHQHLSVIKLNNQSQNAEGAKDLSLKVEFPFSDETSLELSGKRFKLAEASGSSRAVWGLYVMQIHDCSHEFPETVRFTRDDFLCSPPPLEDEAELDGLQIGDPDPDDVDDLSVIDGPADARIKRLAIIEPGGRLSGALKTKFEKRSNLTIGKRQTGRATNEIGVEAGTFGDGHYGADGEGKLGLTAFRHLSDDFTDTLKPFEEMIEDFARRAREQGWSVGVPSFLAQFGERYLSLPQKVGPKRGWHLMDKKQVSGRTRRVAVVEVKLNENAHVYLLELELRPGDKCQSTSLVYRNDLIPLKRKDLDEYLYISCFKRRLAIKSDKFKEKKIHDRSSVLFSTHTSHRIKHHPADKDLIEQAKRQVGAQAAVTRFCINLEAWATSMVNIIGEHFPEV
ncbi:hypothetical protein EB809_19875 [Marinobacter sp. R17]|nr:hypothetical protein EB809_19875 [Marinobacter sp. R17]